MNERVVKDAFVGKVRVAWRAWEELISRVPRTEMELPGFYGERTLKDVIAHISWYERQMVQILEARRFEGSPLWEKTLEERNAVIQEENRDRPLEDVLADSGRVHLRLVELLDGLSDDDLNDAAAFPGMSPEWAPWDVIASNTYEHYDGHAECVRERIGE
jgi:hypothetical protein